MVKSQKYYSDENNYLTRKNYKSLEMIEIFAITLMFVALVGAGIAGIYYFSKDLRKSSHGQH